jgi:hypothetical protein
MLKRISGFLFILLGALITLFFRHYTGTIIPYPWICLLLGLALLATGIYLIRTSEADDDKTNRDNLYQAIAELKSTGERIEVDLRTCSIRTSESLEPDPGKQIDLTMFYIIAPTGLYTLATLIKDRPEDTKGVLTSVIIFPYVNTRTGQTEKFIGPIILKDEVSLSFYLDRQQRTTLYVDKTNRSRYYFDLDFLIDQ